MTGTLHVKLCTFMIIFRYILRIIRSFSDKTYREATFGSMITNDPRYTCEIKSRIAKAKQRSTERRLFSPANWTYISGRE